MDNQQAKTTLNFTTVRDNLPFAAIWPEALDEIPLSEKIVSLIVGVFFLIISIGIASSWINDSNNGSNGVAAAIFLVFLMACFCAAIMALPIMKGYQRARTFIRGTAFAQANGFLFTKGQKEPGFPGVIFSIGDTRRASSMIEGNYNNREFKVFNYSYMQGSGKNRSEYDKGVIMVKLPRKLPNVIFDSKSNNFMGISNLGATFSRSQKFTLEGDFNNHFDVYAPQNYGVDVLYFMTPELMALLVDEAGNYDIEVVDDNLFFYAPEFDFKTKQLDSIFKIIQTIGGEFSENTELYADDRVGNPAMNVVAEPGRRLKQSVSWLSIAAIVIYIVLRILAEVADSR